MGVSSVKQAHWTSKCLIFSLLCPGIMPGSVVMPNRVNCLPNHILLCLGIMPGSVVMPNIVNCLPNHILLCPGIMPGRVDDTK